MPRPVARRCHGGVFNKESAIRDAKTNVIWLRKYLIFNAIIDGTIEKEEPGKHCRNLLPGKFAWSKFSG